MHGLKLGVLIAKYSRGDKIEELYKEYLDLVKDGMKCLIQDII
ncbi:MAG: DUF1910 domain-containing protein [Clostridiales bacterium]|nr:DUF1910 domain-containing protein [Clostridiales bacterium]